jgi:hypothetical protein
MVATLTASPGRLKKPAADTSTSTTVLQAIAKEMP